MALMAAEYHPVPTGAQRGAPHMKTTLTHDTRPPGPLTLCHESAWRSQPGRGRAVDAAGPRWTAPSPRALGAPGPAL